MVRGDVQHRRGFGVEEGAGLHLEGADLAHGDILFLGIKADAGERHADIAHGVGLSARVFEDFGEQSCGGGFSVCAGDGDGSPAEHAPGQLDLGQHFLTLRLCGLHRRVGIRDAGAEHERVGLVHQSDGVFAQTPFHIFPVQRGHALAKLRLGLPVVDNSRAARLRKQLRRCDARARHAHDQYAFICHIFIPPLDLLQKTNGGSLRRPLFFVPKRPYVRQAVKPVSATRHTIAVTM